MFLFANEHSTTAFEFYRITLENNNVSDEMAAYYGKKIFTEMLGNKFPYLFLICVYSLFLDIIKKKYP